VSIKVMIQTFKAQFPMKS